MKKMLLALLVVAAASVSSAAAITWRMNTTAMTSEGKDITSSKAILLMVAKGAAEPTVSFADGKLTLSEGATYLGQGNLSGGILPTTSIAIDGNWNEGTISVAGGAAYGQAGTLATYGAGTNNQKDYYMLIFDSSSISEDSKYVAATLSAKAPTSATGTLTLAFLGKSFDADAWAAVPEPTAVALLLMGVAAVGLKRRA